MKRKIRIFFKILCYLFLTFIILCVGSIIFNKIKDPESPITIFKYQLYVDITNSMAPTLHANDIIIVKKCKKENINVGDIITYREGNSTVTHRVIEKINNDNETRYKTKGDNNNSEDDILITYKDIEGKYLCKIRYLGFFITDKISFVLLVLLILILLYFPYNKLGILKKEYKEK